MSWSRRGSLGIKRKPLMRIYLIEWGQIRVVPKRFPNGKDSLAVVWLKEPSEERLRGKQLLGLWNWRSGAEKRTGAGDREPFLIPSRAMLRPPPTVEERRAARQTAIAMMQPPEPAAA